MDNEILYDITLPGDNTLKQFFDRYYVLPKEPKNYKWTEEEKSFLESKNLTLSDENERLGKDGYIVIRKKKKFNSEQVQQIKNDTGSCRSLAKKYNVSAGTISKIKNDKY